MKHVRRPLPLTSALLAATLCSGAAAQCELAEISGSGASAGDQTGRAVALRGPLGVVGSHADEPWGTLSGSAYVIERSGDSWSETGHLVPADGQPFAYFGYAVAAGADSVLVGAPYDDGYGSNAGAVYVFRKAGATWVQTQKLHPSAAVPFHEFFGRSVACDGDVCAIGSTELVVVFEDQGGTWVETGFMAEPPLFPDTGFAYSVSVSGDRVVAGSPFSGLGGTAYVFEKQAGAWGLAQVLTASDPAVGDFFGNTVAISGDRVLIGAPRKGVFGTAYGAAYAFEELAGAWVQTAKLTASDGHQNQTFGTSIAVEGADCLIGAPGGPTGDVYRFQDTASGWLELGKFGPDHGAPGADFGAAVSLSAGTVLTGDNRHDHPGIDAGAAFAHSLLLCGDASSISLSSGGGLNLDVAAGPALGGSIHLVLGSISGTAGFGIGAILIPLDVDAYFLHTLGHPNAPPLTGALGFLDASGSASASFDLPAGFAPALAGTTVYHACGILDPATAAVLAVSAPVGLALVP